ncbi:spore germination protein [Caproiciproducens sp. NJN-50]|uniref:spore germination protein n=1 Tax=Caproiciproducens sp. NJN-50 TaxID=2507162 RepID=UPI000FFE224C|nr:spore germination protein [Caproiciproducens sp. NJN-50]QAT51115.1 spore germination protein [Caproiciproducens sp. NJN-50]
MSTSDSFAGAKLPADQLEQNIRYLRDLFTGDDTLVFRELENDRGEQTIRFCLVYADGMVNGRLINQDVIHPLLEFVFQPDEGASLIDTVRLQALFSNDVKKTDAVEELIQAIVYGDTVLLAEGCPQALILNTKGFVIRSIAEPESERVIRGPREGFNESILTNLSMLRRKIRTQDLKFKFMTFGRRTKTKACICYLDSVVNRSVLTELERRLEKIDIDGTLDTNYITEIIKDASYSAVKTVGSTERPDIVASKLLEGRVALFLDGTPVVLTVPYLFIEHFQADEDYYVNYIFASIDRILRVLAFILSVCLPADYVAMVTFHQEMLPTPLLMSIFTSRQSVPFPTALEVILMLVVFEMLRESGARMPGIMGQTLSIVGALVIGQAAVDAKIVSAPVVIVVALTGICGLMISRLKGYVIIHRFFLLACACFLGLYGLLLGLLVLLTGLFAMTSFGVPIMPDVYAKGMQNYKDVYVRAPWWTMIKRPKFLSGNKVRQSGGGEKPQ